MNIQIFQIFEELEKLKHILLKKDQRDVLNLISKHNINYENLKNFETKTNVKNKETSFDNIYNLMKKKEEEVDDIDRKLIKILKNEIIL